MFHDGPERVTASEIKDAETIERIRVAGRLAARALAEAAKAIAPGVSTDELDRIAHEYLCDHGAYPSCLGYMGFPKSICTSINEVICHGIPDSTRLNEGDLINLDVTAYIGGVHGDTNATYIGQIGGGIEARLLKNMFDDLDIANRRPYDQWWRDLLPVQRIVSLANPGIEAAPITIDDPES